MAGKILKSEDYEEMASAFQCSQIQLLDKVLKASGISEDKARKITTAFTLDFGVFLDQYWFESEEGKVFPVIGFSEKHQEYEPESYYLNEGSFSFAEYAYGNISWYYEDNAGKEEPQVMGTVNENGTSA